MTDMKPALDKFRQGPSIFEEALRGVTESQADVIPAPGKWTIRQIARHLADTEMVAGVRLRQMIAQDRPTLVPFDQDLWAARLDYVRADLQASLHTFSVLRLDTSKVLDSLPAEAFERIGVHPERGDKSLGEWVTLFGAHVDKHAGQIRSILGKAAE